MIIPYQTETLRQHWPISNYAILAITLAAYLVTATGAVTGAIPPHVIEGLILQGFNRPGALLSYMFLHGSPAHIIGNMIILAVFGNALCSNINNLLYPVLYLMFGILAGMLHLLTGGGPVIGASGAVCGIVGLYLVLYPLNKIHCVYFFSLLARGEFSIRGRTLILLWVGYDLLLVSLGGDGRIAYHAHLAGYLFGVVSGLLLLKSGLIATTELDNPTLLDLLAGTRKSGTENSANADQGFNCPHCREWLLPADDESPGDMVTCPSCQQRFIIPALTTLPAATE